MTSHPQLSANLIPIRCRYCTLESPGDWRTRRDLRICQLRLQLAEDGRARQREFIRRLQERIFDLYEWYTPPPVHGPEDPTEVDEGIDVG